MILVINTIQFSKLIRWLNFDTIFGWSSIKWRFSNVRGFLFDTNTLCSLFCADFRWKFEDRSNNKVWFIVIHPSSFLIRNEVYFLTDNITKIWLAIMKEDDNFSLTHNAMVVTIWRKNPRTGNLYLCFKAMKFHPI